jgi:diaminopropionate ammonia-lyase
MQTFVNRGVSAVVDGAAPTRAPLDFHRRLPGYEPSPLLVGAPEIAARLGLGGLLVKDESSRLGLPSFKILGASWAVLRALEERFGPFGGWTSLDDLRSQLEAHLPLGLAAATDGNHGRAVARMARWLGLGCRIFVPEGTASARIEGIESEGASCDIVAGGYDDAVARSAREAGERCLVISDTSWPGYDTVPRWVIDGYSTIFWEIDDQLEAAGERGPDLVVVQMGVGALAAAAAAHYRRSDVSPRPKLIGVEPDDAACVLASMAAGRVVTIAGPQRSIMAGLNCGTPSPLAWPTMVGGIDFFCAIDDEVAREGMRDVAREGVAAGECSGGAIGAARALLTGPHRQSLAISSDAGVLVLLTEGATDPAGYEEVVGRSPESVTGSPPGGAPAP